MLDGEVHKETFQAERDEFQIAYKRRGVLAFQRIRACLHTALPPRRFYQLRDWYSRSDWRRIRGLLGEPVPNAEIGNVAVQNHEP
jgi:hypothetical protein